MNIRLRNKFMCVFVVTLLISSCTGAYQTNAVQNVPVSTISPTRSKTDTPMLLTSTQTALPGPTEMATLTPSPTTFPPTRQVLQTTLALQAPTWTPLPTLASKESMVLVNELLATNADCSLPCWWGVTPGKTLWTEASHFFDSFTQIQLELEDSIVKDDTRYPYARYRIQYSISSQLSGELVIGVVDGIIAWIQTGNNTTHFGFQLHQILAAHGQPELASIWTVADAPFRPLPFILVLYYQNLNSLIVYNFTAIAKDDILISCPSSEPDPQLYLRPLGEDLGQDEIVKIALGTPPPGGEPPQLRSVYEVTDVDIKAFTRIYQDPGACIETPSIYWQW